MHGKHWSKQLKAWEVAGYLRPVDRTVLMMQMLKAQPEFDSFMLLAFMHPYGAVPYVVLDKGVTIGVVLHIIHSSATGERHPPACKRERSVF